jgi:hypothetical protein
MRHGRVVFVVALLAMTVVGFAMLGPGAAQPWQYAQVWGGPWRGARGMSVRVALVERYRDVETAGTMTTFTATAVASGERASLTATTNADGMADVTLPFRRELGAERPIVSIVSRGRTLAAGTLGSAPSWGSPPRTRRVTGAHSGPLGVDALAGRGVFAAPFPDALIAQVTFSDGPLSGATVELETTGADAVGRQVVTTGQDGSARFVIAPRSHDVDVRLVAKKDALEGSWSGSLPVIPGAMWLDEAALERGLLRVVSPVPRIVAYLSIASRERRIWGASLRLSDGQGEEPWPGHLVGEGDGCIWVTLSSDASAHGSGTVGWPVARPSAGGARRAVAPQETCDEQSYRDVLLLDGRRQAEARESARRGRAQGLAIFALAAAALIEGLILYGQTRDASRGLERLARAAGQDPGAPASFGPRRGLLGLALAIALLLLALSAILVVMLWKTSG